LYQQKQTEIMKTQNTRIERIKNQAISNIEFLQSEKGWSEFKNIMSMAALEMTKKQRKQFFELMKDENEKKNFLIYLFATTSIEAAMLQQQ
jgi:hypothetical protein